MLENLEYDALDESENEAPLKQDYGSQAPPQPGHHGPPPPAPSYHPLPPPPQQVYPAPPVVPVYQQPAYNPVPLPNYTVPVVPEYGPNPYMNEGPQQAYVHQQQQLPPLPPPPPPPPPAQPVYESVVPVYQVPVAPAYQPPAVAAPAYQAPVASNYSTPAATSYVQPQQPVYETISYQQPPPAYEATKPVVVVPPPPSYQPPSYQPPAYQAPSYQAPAYQAPAYQAPAHQAPAYQAPAYQAPAYQAPPVYQKPVVAQQNYSAPAAYEQPKHQQYKPEQHQVAYKQPMQQYLPALIQKYSNAELAPFLSPYNYRSNHWSLFYYRGAQNPYHQRQCPKSPYANGPSYKDIELAFLDAAAQLGQYRQPNYSNASVPSFASRHQIFSLIGQQSVRMDEEGLLVEMVSRHLADRLCLTKWDKQRYLPQLTKFVSTGHFPAQHSCNNYYRQGWQGKAKQCSSQKYRSIAGFCNIPYPPYWGKNNVCHIRLLSPDYADGVSLPRVSTNPRYPLPNPRHIANVIHSDIPLEGPYNLMKMQWGQFINHDITNTALSAYDGLVDCCKQPNARGCWPIYVPPGDRFYGQHNVTCLNFIRSGVCPLCQLGPRQQTNKNTAFLDASHIYGNSDDVAIKLRTFRLGQLRTSSGRQGEIMLPVASDQSQCHGTCYEAGDSRVNQHPALTALHLLLLRNHNYHAQRLAQRHPDWSDELLYQEARRINIAEYQMITYNEYLPIVFGPILSAYYNLIPQRSGHTYYNHQVDPTTWNEYSTASCRFGHSQISSTFGLYSRILGYGQQEANQPSFRLKEWFMRPSLLADGQLIPMVNGLLAKPAQVVDPWLTTDVRNHLYQSLREHTGGDLAATNIWRGRDHALPGYVHYVEYCFNHKVRGWRDLAMFIPPTTLNQMRRLYRVVENIDLFTGGMSERHFPGADIGPTFACINGIQYYHLKAGDRYYFEHGGQAGSFTPPQLDEIRRATLARMLCRTAYLPNAPQYAFMAPSMYNPLVNCSQISEFNHGAF